MQLAVFNVRLYDQCYKKFIELESIEFIPRYQEIVSLCLNISFFSQLKKSSNPVSSTATYTLRLDTE